MSNVNLYVFGGADGLDSASPYCLKVLHAARYKKVPFKTKLVGARMPAWAKRGTLPVAEIDGRQVEDSSHILRALDGLTSAAPRLYPEDKAALADTVILESWADEWLTLFPVYYRWAVDAHFQPFFAQVTKGIPNIVRTLVGPGVRKNVVKMIKGRGVGHDTEAERRAAFSDALDALEQRLAARPFLTCDSPTAADFAVFGVLSIVDAVKFQEIWPILDAHPGLKTWLKRMREVSGA